MLKFNNIPLKAAVILLEYLHVDRVRLRDDNYDQTKDQLQNSFFPVIYKTYLKERTNNSVPS